ncbi:MAG: hypothetical protein ACPGO5_00365 [Patescibacteria group bacterium]
MGKKKKKGAGSSNLLLITNALTIFSFAAFIILTLVYLMLASSY